MIIMVIIIIIIAIAIVIIVIIIKMVLFLGLRGLGCREEARCCGAQANQKGRAALVAEYQAQLQEQQASGEASHKWWFGFSSRRDQGVSETEDSKADQKSFLA